jgi:hypothetical protein
MSHEGATAKRIFCAILAEMRRWFCVLAFCAANYKTGICKVEIPFRTFAMLHIYPVDNNAKDTWKNLLDFKCQQYKENYSFELKCCVKTLKYL